jgi:GMP synthase-like glutamine amidotransferase
MQEAWLTWANKNNKPVLGVCGGSRRLAQFSGGATAHLTEDAQDMHRGNFNTPNVIKHEVFVAADSQLGKLLATGNYRALPKEVQLGVEALVKSKAIRRTVIQDKLYFVLDVNSMHWAQSIFPSSAAHIELSAHAPDKTLEGWSRRDRSFCMGVQWHPEYAQTGEGHFGQGRAKPHANIMRGLGQAAEEDYAVRVIQSAVRAFIERQEVEREQQRRQAEAQRRERQEAFAVIMSRVAESVSSYGKKPEYSLF